MMRQITEALPLFSNADLGQLLGFLQTGKIELLYHLIQEKVDEYQIVMEEMNTLKHKLEVRQIQNQEQQEKTQDQEPDLQSLSLI